MSNTEFGITLKANGQGEFVGVVNAAEASLNQLGSTAHKAGSDINAGTDKGREGIAKITNEANTLDSTLQKVGLAAGAYFGLSALVHYAGGVIRVADEYTGLQSRLKLATQSQSEFNLANSELFNIAQRNHTPLSETFSLYSKLSPAMSALGQSQAQTLQMTELVSKSLLISGAGAAQSGAAMLQFAQAMGSGVLRGDEFNSLMENSPRLMQAVADGMNKPLGALRGLAEQGKLSAEEVSAALLSQAAKLESEAAKMPLTVSAAMVNMSNAVMQEVAGLDKASGATSNLAGGLKFLTDHAHGLIAGLAGVSVAAATYGSLKLGGVALDAAQGILAKSTALTAERTATLASAQAATVAAAAEVERTAALARATAASAALTGSTAASRAASIAATEATTLHTAALVAENAAKTASAASSSMAGGAVAMLGGPLGLITIALGLGAAAWSLWGNRAEQAAQQANDALAKHQKFSAEHGLDEKTYLQKQLAEAKAEEKSLALSGIKNSSVMGNLFTTTDLDLAAKKRAEVKAIEDKLSLDAEKEKNQNLRAIDSSAWEKLNQTTAQKHAEALATLDKTYLAQINGQNLSQERSLQLAAEYETKKAVLMAKGEPHTRQATPTPTDPLQSGIDSITADHSRAQLLATGATAATAASELKLYELAIKGIDAATKLDAEGKHAAAAALREHTAQVMQAMRLTTDATEATKAATVAKEAEKKATEDATKFIDKMNQSAKDYALAKAIETEADGKSIVEKAGLVAQKKAELEIDQEIAKFEAMRKDNPAAADAGVKALSAAKPAAVDGAVNAAKNKASDSLVTQAEQAAGGAENDRYAKELEAQAAFHATSQSSEAANNAALANIHQAHSKKILAMMMQGQLSAQQFAKLDDKTRRDITVGGLEMALGSLAGHNKKAFEMNKAYSTGQAIISTYQAVAGTLAMYPGPPGWAMAAAQLAMGYAQVSAIQSASFGGGGGAGGAPAAPSAPPPQTPSYTPTAGGAPVNSDGSTTPSATINITVQALHPDAISAATMQQVADGLAPSLQAAFGRNGQNVAVLV